MISQSDVDTLVHVLWPAVAFCGLLFGWQLIKTRLERGRRVHPAE